jgi:hypothetical protein
LKGGNINYYVKYLKYKNKYLLLKKKWLIILSTYCKNANYL